MKMERPKWQEDLYAYSNIKTTFILAGNVHDLQPDFDPESGKSFASTMDNYLYNYLRNVIGYSRVVFYNRVDGFYNTSNPQMKAAFDQSCDRYLGNSGEDASSRSRDSNQKNYTFKTASIILREALADSSEPTAMVFDLATSAIKSPSNLTDEEQEAFSRLLAASKKPMGCQDPASGKQLTNTLFIIVDKVNDLPSWLYVNNPYVKTLTVGKPTRLQREAFVKTQMDKAPEPSPISLRSMKKTPRNLLTISATSLTAFA